VHESLHGNDRFIKEKRIRQRPAGVDAPSISRHSRGEVTSDLKLRFRFKVERTSHRPGVQVDGARAHTLVRPLYTFVVIAANDGSLAIHLAETSPLTEVNDG